MAYHILKDLTHDQWLDQRAKGIGSSEVGTILGVNPYETPYELWLRKTGQAPPKQTTDQMELGHILEPWVAQKFSENSGAVIKLSSKGDWLAVDNDRDFLRVSPDRLYWPAGMKHCPKNWGIVECKTSTTMDVDPENPPLYWQMQLQYQMGVMGIKQGAIAWVTMNFGIQAGHRTYAADREFFEKEMVPRLEYFWKENILRGIEPTPKTELELKLAYPSATPEKTVISDEEINAALTEFKKLSQQEKDIKASLSMVGSQKDVLRNLVRSYMKDAESLLSEDGKILATWKNTKDTETFDMVRFRAEQEELYKQFITTEKGSRRLTIK